VGKVARYDTSGLMSIVESNQCPASQLGALIGPDRTSILTISARLEVGHLMKRIPNRNGQQAGKSRRNSTAIMAANPTCMHGHIW